eukprot:3078561-Pleurochrysis_carterae.AAC.1
MVVVVARSAGDGGTPTTSHHSYQQRRHRLLAVGVPVPLTCARQTGLVKSAPVLGAVSAALGAKAPQSSAGGDAAGD